MSAITQDIETLGINTARILAADAVQKANSGHPGTPMALSPMAHVFWTKMINYNPKNPDWAGRDRFILSAGHACMLQYAYLYLTGYDLTLDDIKNFRQMNSNTAGHPEYGLCPGIEVTTGPLGQGFANAIGFAIGQKHLAARYNKPGFNLFDYKIYVICSDGDMMEGVTSEAASIAGHLELGNLIFLYDNNHISIEGSTDIAFTEDVSKRFEAYGWHTQNLTDVNDTHALELALINAKSETQKPSLINVRSLIAYGSPNKSGTAGSHGSPLGADEVKLVKEFFGFDPNKSFYVPDEVLEYYHKAGEKGAGTEEKWNKLFADYKAQYPELAEEYETAVAGKLPKGWDENLPVFKASDPKVATRVSSGKALNALAEKIPYLIGGAADLAPSTDTNLKNYDSFTSENRVGRNFHFGIREHAMGSALNGMALTAGVIPFGATFLMFSEYMRPPIRLASIMQISPVFVYTHDSIGLGEDGTTHQPVEQLASLRSIPRITVIRPADANETVQAWRVAVEHKGGPVVLVFTRQGLPILDQDKYGKATELEKGAYILSEGSKGPDLILIATGSEVQLIMQAQEKLEAEGISTRVVSMPSWELFEKQSDAYKEKVFPKANRKRLAVEMASPMGWHKYTTDEGDMLGINRFGESAKAEDLLKEYGFTVDNVVKRAKALL